MKYNLTPLQHVVSTITDEDEIVILNELLVAFEKGSRYPVQFYASGEAGSKLSATSFQALEKVLRSSTEHLKFKRKLCDEDEEASKSKKQRVCAPNQGNGFHQQMNRFLMRRAKYGDGVKIVSSDDDEEDEPVKP